MKITINEKETFEDTEILINCPKVNDEIIRILATLRSFDQKITGIKDGETYLLHASKILYIESVDKKTFLYTETAVYETPLRLYELEERLGGSGFFRAAKAVILNYNRIKSLRPDFGGRMSVTMSNHEVMMVSRQYVPVIKKKLGLK